MYQVLANKDFKNAVKEISLKNTHCVFSNAYSSYEVWELNDDDWEILTSYRDKYDYFEEGEEPLFWQDNWGWWRWTDGSNIESYPVRKIKINSKKIDGFFNKNKQNDYISERLEDFIERYGTIIDTVRVKLINQYTKEYEKSFDNHSYATIVDYLSQEFGATTEKNVCAILTSLAKLNNKTLGDFMNYLY